MYTNFPAISYISQKRLHIPVYNLRAFLLCRLFSKKNKPKTKYIFSIVKPGLVIFIVYNN